MPGFRPGKVPVSVVKKMVGMSVLMDELGKKLNQELSQYIQEEKLQILGEPLQVEQHDKLQNKKVVILHTH